MTDPHSPNQPDTADDPSGIDRMMGELGDDAARLKHATEERAGQQLDGGRRKAAAAATSTASAIREAAGSLRQDEDAPEWLASALETTAGKISGFASTLEGASASEIRHGINDFAREHPATFLAASAAAGFAASRFLRAGAAYEAHHPRDDTRKSSGVSPSSPPRKASEFASDTSGAESTGRETASLTAHAQGASHD